MHKKWIISAIIFSLVAYRIATRDYPLLVVGCARSGTTYIAKVLKKCGWKINHERVKRDGAVSWEMVFDTKQVPWGSPQKGRKFAHTFHQVRHPLFTISSVYHAELPESWEYVMEHIPEITPNDSPLVRAAKYWYYWNLEAEKISEWTYRIEDIDQVFEEFERRVGKRIDRAALTRVPRNVNTTGVHHQFTWEELQEALDPDLYEKIRQLSERYGY